MRKPKAKRYALDFRDNDWWLADYGGDEAVEPVETLLWVPPDVYTVLNYVEEEMGIQKKYVSYPKPEKPEKDCGGLKRSIEESPIFKEHKEE